jgi:hypothetical protein
MVAITFAEAKAIVWDAEAATWPLGVYEIELLGCERRNALPRPARRETAGPGASGPESGHRPSGPWGNPGSLPFLEFVEDAGSLLSVLFWRDLPIGEQPIDSRKSLLCRLL